MDLLSHFSVACGYESELPRSVINTLFVHTVLLVTRASGFMRHFLKQNFELDSLLILSITSRLSCIRYVTTLVT